MRANGVSHFPDPTTGPGGEGFNGLFVTGDGSLTVDGISFAGPALKQAEGACKVYLPPGGPAPAVPESEKLQALAFARCLRAHGVPNFPDPSFSSGGGPTPQNAGINPSSPAVQVASEACGARGGGNFSLP